MQNNLISFFAADSIGQSVANSVAWGIFAFVLLLTFFGFLAGFAKGLLKTTVKTVIKGVLVLVFVFTAPLIAKALGNIDFTNMNWTVQIPNGTDASGSMVFRSEVFSTPINYLADFLTGTGLISPMNGISVYELAISIATSLLSYIVFLVLMILTQIFISLITAIIYNVFLRWFLPTESMKARKRHLQACHNNKRLADVTEDLIDDDGNTPAKRKFSLHRGWGGALGATQEFIFACTMFAPITSLARTVVNNRENIDLLLTKMSRDDDKATYNEYADTISNAWIYKLLGVFNYDTVLMNRISSENDLHTSFNVMVNSSFKLAEPVLNSDAIRGSYEEGTTKITINFSKLMSYNLVNQVIDATIENKAIMGLIPPLVDVAVNYAAQSSNIPIDKLTFDDVDWSSDLTALKSIYETVYTKGLNTIVKADGTGLDVSLFNMPTSQFTDSDIAAIGEAVRKLGNLSAVKPNLCILAEGLGSYLSSLGYDILTGNASDYADVDWGNDLANFVTNALKLIRDFKLDINSALKNSVNAGMFSDNSNDVAKKIKEGLREKSTRSNIKAYLIGDSGILNSDLIKHHFRLSTLVNSVLATVSSLKPLLETSAYRSALASLDDNGELKAEIGHAFDIMDILLADNAAVSYEDFLKLTEGSLDRDTVLSFVNDDVCDELIQVLTIAEESSLFNSLYGPVMKTYLYKYYEANKKNSDITQYFFGLTPYSFDYDSENFTHDLKGLIRQVPSLKALYEKYSDSSSSSLRSLLDKMTDEDIDTISGFLKTVAQSQFLNATMLDGASDTDVRNRNISIVLSNIFSLNGLKDLHITLPSVAEMENIEWVSLDMAGQDSNQGEIDQISKVLKDIIASRDLIDYVIENSSKLTSNSRSDYSALKTLVKNYLRTQDQQNTLYNLIVDSYHSDVLRQTALNTVTNRLQNFLTNHNIPFSLNELRNYAYLPENNDAINEDLESWRRLIPLLNKLDYHQIYQDFKDKKYSKLSKDIDNDVINAIITSFTTSNIYQNTNAKLLVPIGAYVAARKLGAFTASKLNLPDYGWTAFDPATYGTDWTTQTATNTTLIAGNTYTVTTDGVIDIVLRLKTLAENAGLKQAISEKKMPTIPAGWLDDNRDMLDDPYFRGVFGLYGPSVLNYGVNRFISRVPEAYRQTVKNIIPYINFPLITEKNPDGTWTLDLYHELVQAKKLAKDAFGTFKGSRFITYVKNHATSLDPEALDRIKEMMDIMGKDEFLNSVKEGQEMSPISAAAMQLETFQNGKYLKYITANETADNGVILKAIVMDIQKSGWDNEMDSLYNVLVNAQGLGPVSNHDFYAEGRNAQSLKKLFDAMNRDKLLHRALIQVIKKAIRKADLESMVDMSRHPLRFDVHLGTTDDDVAYWQNDYEAFIEMIYDEELKPLFRDSSKISTKTFESINVRFLYYLGQMHLFEDSRSEIIYSILKKYKNNTTGEPITGQIFQESRNTPYGEDTNSWRMEDLYFSNKTHDDNTLFDEPTGLKDADMTNTMIDYLMKQASNFQNAGDIDQIYNALHPENGENWYFANLHADALAVDNNGDLYRSYLSSEILAGIMKIMITNPSLESSLGAFEGLDFYADDWALVNPLEGNALDVAIEIGYNTKHSGSGDVKTAGQIQLESTVKLDMDDIFGEMAPIPGVTFPKGSLIIPITVPRSFTAYFSRAGVSELFGRLQGDVNSTNDVIRLVSQEETYQSSHLNSAMGMRLAKPSDDGTTIEYNVPEQTVYDYLVTSMDHTVADLARASGKISNLKIPVTINHSIIGMQVVRTAEGFKYLDDVLDFSKLDTMSFLDLLASDTTIL